MDPRYHQRVVQAISSHLFGEVMTNAARGLFVEGMIATALGDSWKWQGGWWHYDFKHVQSGMLLEVKQSAARQTWEQSHPTDPRFSLKVPGSVDMYIFAWNGEYGEGADHRDPVQWEFFVISAPELPDQNSIGLRPLRRLCVSSCPLGDLAHVVAARQPAAIRARTRESA